MDSTKLAATVGLLIALSAASERMVEIVKGLCPWLDTKNEVEKKTEARRKVCLQLLAVAAGIVTTLAARPAIPKDLLPDSAGFFPVLALGFLASGGSGLWNSVLTYVLQVKNIKEGLAAVAETKGKLAEGIAKIAEEASTTDATARSSSTTPLAQHVAVVASPLEKAVEIFAKLDTLGAKKLR